MTITFVKRNLTRELHITTWDIWALNYRKGIKTECKPFQLSRSTVNSEDRSQTSAGRGRMSRLYLTPDLHSRLCSGSDFSSGYRLHAPVRSLPHGFPRTDIHLTAPSTLPFGPSPYDKSSFCSGKSAPPPLRHSRGQTGRCPAKEAPRSGLSRRSSGRPAARASTWLRAPLWSHQSANGVRAAARDPTNQIPASWGSLETPPRVRDAVAARFASDPDGGPDGAGGSQAGERLPRWDGPVRLVSTGWAAGLCPAVEGIREGPHSLNWDSLFGHSPAGRPKKALPPSLPPPPPLSGRGLPRSAVHLSGGLPSDLWRRWEKKKQTNRRKLRHVVSLRHTRLGVSLTGGAAAGSTRTEGNASAPSSHFGAVRQTAAASRQGSRLVVRLVPENFLRLTST